ncbi:MAG: MarR family transcriptional regulator [Pseudoflavonifractor sp.]|nr:MarR family transcriptional regulator [Pseudoflavonifractor sp.]
MIDQNSCGALIKQIHDELEKNANNAMRIQNITMAQCVALVVLHGAPEQQMSLKELERQLHVAQSTAAGVVARLEQKELVESFGSPEDRRIKIVRLTPAGVERCRMAEQNMQEAEENLLSGLTETERSIFLSLLKKVRDTL